MLSDAAKRDFAGGMKSYGSRGGDMCLDYPDRPHIITQVGEEEGRRVRDRIDSRG